MAAGKTTVKKAQGGAVDPKQQSNDALRRAIRFSGLTLLTNLIYFGWRATAIGRSFFTSNPGQTALYVALFVVEWTFAGK